MKSVPALYLSLSVMTALREVNQVGNLQPTTLVSYDAEIDDVFDSRDEAAIVGAGMDMAALRRHDMAGSDEERREKRKRRPLPADLSPRATMVCSSGFRLPVRALTI